MRDAAPDPDGERDPMTGSDPGAVGDPDPDPGSGSGNDPAPSPAAAAPNWRSVVAVDVGVGVIVVVVGVVLSLAWQPVVGAGIASLGLVYATLAWRRGQQWAAWRRRNGLDGNR